MPAQRRGGWWCFGVARVLFAQCCNSGARAPGTQPVGSPAPDGSGSWRQSSLVLPLQGGREGRRQGTPPSPVSPSASNCSHMRTSTSTPCIQGWFEQHNYHPLLPPAPRHSHGASPVCLRGTVPNSGLHTQGLQEVSPSGEQRPEQTDRFTNSSRVTQLSVEPGAEHRTLFFFGCSHLGCLEKRLLKLQTWLSSF